LSEYEPANEMAAENWPVTTHL